MAIFSIDLDVASKKALLQSKSIAKLTNSGVINAFRKIGQDLVRDAEKQILQRPKHGRLYKIKVNGRSKSHRASAPYEHPANITGKLRKSLGYRVNGSRQMQFGAGNKTDVKYALYLEEGTKKMEARNYLQRTIKENQNNIRDRLNQEIQKVLTTL